MQQLLDTLKQCGYDPYFVQTRQEALELSKTFIKDGMSVGLGGSTTVSEIGLLDEIVKNKNITLFNQYEKGISMEENTKRRREGMLTDLYVTGTNALTKDGKLVNADGSGNRVAALIFGPKKVLVVIGINKIVENLDEGFKRLMEVAAV
jgi:L-lactate utilization protein LutB